MHSISPAPASKSAGPIIRALISDLKLETFILPSTYHEFHIRRPMELGIQLKAAHQINLLNKLSETFEMVRPGAKVMEQ